jgi:putative phage-type endonuclease
MSVTSMSNFTRISYETFDEWKAKRSLGIGGSDASAVLGLNPYRTNIDLWKNKTRREQGDVPENEFMRYGKAVEDSLRTIFANDYHQKLFIHSKPEVLRNNTFDFLLGSLDGEILVLEETKFTPYWKSHYAKDDDSKPQPMVLKPGMRGVLEIKTTEVLSSMHKEKWNNHVPQNYYIQVLHYLLVTGYDFAILVAQFKFTDSNNVKTNETRHYGFMALDRIDDMKILLENEIKFWNEYVLKDVEPPLIINF